ncbi:MarR family winged helix-turn-helix transcriptional regulator [Actinoplanes sp. NPDC051343]|uniref:MarR family winged helix-turn-helix transcriptional regulator n=1 Tax=Actinoplanes sp. NPDC051343 TaxID=3363906 RepID=UPI0037B26224
MDQIEAVRDFNRYYSQRIGALDDHYLGQGRPLREARLLFEIGDGADLRELRARLGLDSGYLSRLLQVLQKDGLVTVGAHAGDGRLRFARLTALGVRERAELDTRSRHSVEALLGALCEAERGELVEAQSRVRHLLRKATVTISAIPDDSPEARDCLRAYAAELAVRFPEGYDETTLITPGSTSSFLVAREEDRPVGCVAWCHLSGSSSGSSSGSGSGFGFGSGFGEVRHLWVSPEARGLGLGRRLLSAVEASIAADGLGEVRLGTHPALAEAIALYLSSGYREIPPYGSSPYDRLAFAKTL